jgi:hypothetical protein
VIGDQHVGRLFGFVGCEQRRRFDRCGEQPFAVVVKLLEKIRTRVVADKKGEAAAGFDILGELFDCRRRQPVDVAEPNRLELV